VFGSRFGSVNAAAVAVLHPGVGRDRSTVAGSPAPIGRPSRVGPEVLRLAITTAAAFGPTTVRGLDGACAWSARAFAAVGRRRRRRGVLMLLRLRKMAFVLITVSSAGRPAPFSQPSRHRLRDCGLHLLLLLHAPGGTAPSAVPAR